jgi:hypothetical protein
MGMKINFEWKNNEYQEDELYINTIWFGAVGKTVFGNKIEFYANFIENGRDLTKAYFNSKEKAKYRIEENAKMFVENLIKGIEI